MNDHSKWIEDFVDDLWFRFRAIAQVIDQTPRFVAITPGAKSISEQELWLRAVGGIFRAGKSKRPEKSS